MNLIRFLFYKIFLWPLGGGRGCEQRLAATVAVAGVGIKI